MSKTIKQSKNLNMLINICTTYNYNLLYYNIYMVYNKYHLFFSCKSSFTL